MLYVLLGNSSGSMGSFFPFFEGAIPSNELSNAHDSRPPRHYEVVSSLMLLHPDIAEALDVRAISGLPRLRTRDGTRDVIVLVRANSLMLRDLHSARPRPGIYFWKAPNDGSASFRAT